MQFIIRKVQPPHGEPLWCEVHFGKDVDLSTLPEGEYLVFEPSDENETVPSVEPEVLRYWEFKSKHVVSAVQPATTVEEIPVD